MKSRPEFIAHIKDLMSDVPNVRVRALFGGHGLFRDGLMFALLADDLLYFRANGERGEALRLKGARQFSATVRGKTVNMPYYRATDDALEDPELTTAMALESFADAMVADQQKPASKRKHRPRPI
ncbi:MAG: TfoX/Sxy family protein [Myxococcales bacterium]|nr:TfoX/Sxy family protein [Myxococcales bacterium]